MNTLQIERLLKRDAASRYLFRKVCALDELEPASFPSAYVINSQTSDQPGEHWVAVYFDRHGRGEYFDSYGLPPEILGLEPYMNQNASRGWIYNRKTLQGMFSTTCGHYCVYYLLFRCRGVPLHAIVSPFTANLYDNDRRVTDFIYRLK